MVLSAVLVTLRIWCRLGQAGGQVVAVLSSGAIVLVGSATGVLWGTRWGFGGLYSDAGFRTEMVTRFADSPRLSDYAYRGLPSYYPPLLPWVQGRIAAVLGVPGWAVMKPFQLVLCLLVPFLSWLLWRRVVADPLAAWVAVVVAVGTALPMKPDEWLVLTLVVPWWLDVVRGVRGVRGVRVTGTGAPRTWGAGTVLGLLLLCHTFFFAPLAVATVLGVLFDVLARRPRTLAWRQALGIVAVAAVVSVVSWLPQLALRLRGARSDNLQMRWSTVGFDVPFYPLHPTLASMTWIMGAVWIAASWRRSDVSRGLGLAVAASLTYTLLGQVAQGWGVAVLPEKAQELSQALLLAAGTLGLAAAAAQLRGQIVRHWSGFPVKIAFFVPLMVVSVFGLSQWTSQHMQRPAGPAQHMRYPNGSWPSGGPPRPTSHWHPWGVSPASDEPSAAEVERTWRELTGRSLQDRTVLISARADVLATSPAFTFVSWKSIYSNPLGQFVRRLDELRDLSACSDSGCAHLLLSRDALEPVDGLILNRDEQGYYLTLTVDSFPNAWTSKTLHFRPELFLGPGFRSRLLPDMVVISVR